MSTQPTPKAWETDEFWSEVVNVITGGKRLRPEHYLASLDAPALESLRLALSSSGTLAEQQKLCPPRRGGRLDGELPSIRCLSELSSAVRQTWMLRRLERQSLIESAAKKRCGELGLDTALTDAVCTVVGEEALAQAAQNQVGDFSVKAAQVLMARQKGKLDAATLELKRTAEARAERETRLAEEKFRRDTCDLFLKWRDNEEANRIASSGASHAEKLDQLYLTMFGKERSA